MIPRVRFQEAIPPLPQAAEQGGRLATRRTIRQCAFTRQARAAGKAARYGERGPK